MRSIFVKRGRGVNALEKLFTFIVILKEEFVADNPSKLWRKIREKIHDWIKLLTKENRAKFRWNDGLESFLHMPSEENVFLRDGKVGQVFLDNLCETDFQQNVFVVLVDKQLFKFFSLHWDEKGWSNAIMNVASTRANKALVNIHC